MAATHGLGTYGNGVGTVTPQDHKLALAGLVVKETTGKIRSGVFYDGTANIVTGAANMSYNVARFTAALSRGVSSGAVLLANDGTVNVATTAAPGSNSRIDVVYVWQREYALDGVNSEPVIGVVQGTPAASPAVPSLAAFPGALELAQIRVPAGVTATNTGTTITQSASFTATAGAPVPFRTLAEMNATTSLPSGTPGIVLADLSEWTSAGTTWSASGLKPGLNLVKPTSVVGGAANAAGAVTVTAASSVALNGVFTSQFKRYKIVVSGTSSSAASVTLGLRVAGATNATANYHRQIDFGSAAVASAASTASDTKWELAVSGRTIFDIDLDLMNPAVAANTFGLAKGVAALAGATAMVAFTTGLGQAQSLAFDGFALSVTAGTFTGTVMVYGYYEGA